MHHWTRSSLVQVMACCLLGAKWLPETMLVYFHWITRNKTSVTFEIKYRNYFFREATFENVDCKMLILFRPQCIHASHWVLAFIFPWGPFKNACVFLNLYFINFHSREIRCYNDCITLKFYMSIISTIAERPVKFQIGQTTGNLQPYLSAHRFREILW